MRYPFSFFLALLLLIGCTADTSGSASDAQARATDSSTAAATPTSTTESATESADLPPSRAGDAQPADDYEATFSKLLGQVVTDAGNVRYDLLRGRLNEDFRRVLKTVEDYDASQLQSQNEKMAFWINAYNVEMLANVLGAWPVEDVSAHSEQFFNTPVRVAGMALSLDQIESAVLRKQDAPPRLQALQPDSLDPRLHAAVNCAAVSCPRLRSRALTPETVDAMLDDAMRDFTGSTEHFRRDGDAFTLSSILKWYGTDFDQTGPPAGDFLLSFMPADRPDRDAFQQLLEGRSAEEIQQQENVSFAYDWTLNAASDSS